VYKYSDGAYLGEWSGTTKGEAYGECSDRAGHVFVGATSATIDAKSAVLEFAHGGTNPIKVLSDPSGYAAECSVDPVSGNLAVINGGAVLIYAGASGYPTKYTDPNMSFNFVGYDGNGNLFVDGSGSTSLAELPKGGNSFKPIKLNQAIGYPGSVQWDGKYMTVEDYDTSVIYRFAITGRRGRKIGSTPLLVNGYGGLLQPPTWIFGKRVIAIFQVVCTSFCSDVAPIYDYPAGGNPAKLLGSGSNSVEVTSVDGITVSPPD
jgi:hypothetical protein